MINSIGNLGGFLGPYSVQVVNGDPDNPGASPQSLYLLAASFAVATVALLLLKVEREKRLDTAAAGDASPDGRPALDGQVPEARSPAGRHVER